MTPASTERVDRALHLAAMPMPTAQGTQAAVRAIADAHGRAGVDVHLLTYGYGADDECGGAFRWVRGGERGCGGGRATPARVGAGRALRSGPSVRKALDDAALIGATRRLIERTRPDVVIAHHVEAMLVALAATATPAGLSGGRGPGRGPIPLVFVAHTDLGPELPAYLPRAAAPLAPLAAAAGAALDRWLVARAGAALAVAPALAARLTRLSGRPVQYLPVPWGASAPWAEPRAAGADWHAAQREAARARLGLPRDAQVVGYVGNVDAYQGLEVVVAAVSTLCARSPREGWRLLLATAAPPRDLERLLGRAATSSGRPPIDVRPLRGVRSVDDAARDDVYTAADVIAVPRALPGGVPIKLLDALAHGATVVAMKRACAGLAIGDAVRTCEDDSPAALAAALSAAVAASAADPAASAARATLARRYLLTEHAPERCALALAGACAEARGATGAARARRERPRET